MGPWGLVTASSRYYSHSKHTSWRRELRSSFLVSPRAESEGNLVDNEWLVLIVRTNIRRLKGFVGLDSLRRTRAINSQTRAELMFLLFRSRRALHKLWQFLRSFQWEMALAETFAVWHTQNVSILCVNTKRCFKLCSYTPLGIQMRLKIWLLIWITPGPGFVPPSS